MGDRLQQSTGKHKHKYESHNKRKESYSEHSDWEFVNQPYKRKEKYANWKWQTEEDDQEDIDLK